MKLGRFLSITEVEQTIQQFFETDWWINYLASVMATHNDDPAANPAAIDAHDTLAAAHVGAVNVPCLILECANQSLTQLAYTDISWTNEVLDTEGFWIPGSPTLITIPEEKAGFYLASLFIFIAKDESEGNSWASNLYFDGIGYQDGRYVEEGSHTKSAVAHILPLTAACVGKAQVWLDGYWSLPVNLEYARLVMTRLRAI